MVGQNITTGPRTTAWWKIEPATIAYGSVQDAVPPNNQTFFLWDLVIKTPIHVAINRADIASFNRYNRGFLDAATDTTYFPILTQDIPDITIETGIQIDEINGDTTWTIAKLIAVPTTQLTMVFKVQEGSVPTSHWISYKGCVLKKLTIINEVGKEQRMQMTFSIREIAWSATEPFTTNNAYSATYPTETPLVFYDGAVSIGAGWTYMASAINARAQSYSLEIDNNHEKIWGVSDGYLPTDISYGKQTIKVSLKLVFDSKTITAFRDIINAATSIGSVGAIDLNVSTTLTEVAQLAGCTIDSFTSDWEELGIFYATLNITASTITFL